MNTCSIYLNVACASKINMYTKNYVVVFAVCCSIFVILFNVIALGLCRTRTCVAQKHLFFNAPFISENIMWSKNSGLFCLSVDAAIIFLFAVMLILSLRLSLPLNSQQDNKMLLLFHYCMLIGLYMIFQFDHINVYDDLPFAHITGVFLLFFGFVFYAYHVNTWAHERQDRYFKNLGTQLLMLNDILLLFFVLCFFFSSNLIIHKVAIAVEYALFFVVVLELVLLNFFFYSVYLQN